MKKTHLRSRSLRAGLCALALLVGGTTTAAAASTAHAKHLSLKTVTIAGGQASVNWASMWSAAAKGFYAKQGLTVNFFDSTSNTSAASLIAALISGSYNFIGTVPAAIPLAIEQGAPIRSILSPDVGGTDELAISTSAAAAHNIPNTGTLAQLRALKGSHLAIGYVNPSAATYLDLVAVLKANGVTTTPGGDLNMQSVGSASNEAAGLAAGKLDGFVNIPPNSVVPNTIAIQYGTLSPVSKEPYLPITTTVSMIQSHPDTVQAFVTGTVEGWNWVRTHAQPAEHTAAAHFAAAGITSPETAQYLFGLDQQHRGTTPEITRGEFNATKSILNTAEPTPITISYNQWVVTRFVDNAIKTLHLHLPT